MTEVAAPALGVSFKVLLGKNKEVVFQTHIDQNKLNGELNGMLDALDKAADRQMARNSLDELKHQWELRKLRLSNMVTDFYAIEMREKNKAEKHASDPKRHGPWKRNEVEQRHHDELRSALERAEAEVKEFERLYKEAEAAAA